MARLHASAAIAIAAVVLSTAPAHAQILGTQSAVSGDAARSTPSAYESNEAPVQGTDSHTVKPVRSAQQGKQSAYRERPSLRAFPRIGERIQTRLFPRVGPAEETETVSTAR